MNDATTHHFGPHLRQARETVGLSLQQLADITKISARVLDALERNDVSKLPGGIFSRSFVRTYAREVGLDPEATVARFIEAFPPGTDEEGRPSSASAYAADEGSFESGRRTVVTLLQVLGLCVVVLVAFFVYRSLRPEPASGPVGLAPVTTPAPATPLSAPDPEPPATEAPATSGLPAPPSAMPAAGGATGSVTAESGSLSNDLERRSPQPGGESTPLTATPELPIALSILASEECWLSLSVDGQKVVSRNLQAGERVQFRGRTRVTLSAGNAGGLALTINGKPARALGARGEVVHTTFTIESLSRMVQ